MMTDIKRNGTPSRSLSMRIEHQLCHFTGICAGHMQGEVLRALYRRRRWRAKPGELLWKRSNRSQPEA